MEINPLNNEKKEYGMSYRVPGRNIALYMSLFLLYLLVFVSLIVLPFALNFGKAYGWLFVGLYSFVLGAFFLVFMVFKFDLFTSPISRWLLDTVRCPKCGSRFNKSICAFLPTSFLGFGVFCQGCKIPYIAATGMFDRTMRIFPFPGDEELKKDANMQRLKKILSR